MPLLTEQFVGEEVLFDDLERSESTTMAMITRSVRTSLQTNSSSGSVVNIFSPKQNRATLINVSFYEEEYQQAVWDAVHRRILPLQNYSECCLAFCP
jgi:hypothetical protein